MGALLLGVLVGAAWPDKRNEGAQRRFLEPSLTALCLSGVTVVAAWRIPLAADVRPYQEIVATFYSRRSTALILFGMAALVSCLAAAAAVARLRKGKEKLDVPRLGVAAFQALLAAVTISMAMGARRFIPLALVMMSPLLGQRVPWLSQRAGGSLVPILAAAALIVPLARVAPKQVRHYQPNNPLFAEEDFCERMHYSRDSFGFGVTEFINANGLHGRIFEDWGWEGYLHWRCPQLKLFVGDRAQQVYTEEMFRKQEDVRNGRGAAEILAEYRIPLAAVPLANYDAFLNSTAMNPQGRWAVIYCDGQGMVLADTSYAEQADLAGRTITGQLRYPNAAAAAMSRAFCLMSPVVGAPGDQTLAAVKAANELDPIPQTYLALAPALLNKTSLQAELLVYVARENQRLATMDYHRPNGRRLLGSRIVVAEFLARCRQAEGRFAEAERLRQEAVRLKTQLESLGW
jgi:hypothetical protein